MRPDRLRLDHEGFTLPAMRGMVSPCLQRATENAKKWRKIDLDNLQSMGLSVYTVSRAIVTKIALIWS